MQDKSIKREHYLEQIMPFYDSDLIKIITGIRRCGKSIILNQIAKQLESEGKEVLLLNFEDKKVLGNISSCEDLLRVIDEKFGKVGAEKVYLFFDEIQNVDGWQDACKTLRLYNYSIFITGSNSKLLSGEFTKELSGRYVSFRVRPFVYKEIVKYCEMIGRECSISDYLVYGGFPKRFEFESIDSQLIYLNDINDTIVINDLIKRYNIRKVGLFENFVNYVLKSNARILSVKSITDYINANYDKCSVNTIMKYLKYLEEAYIIDFVKQYSAKVKKELDFYVKIYNEDVSFNSIRCFDGRFDITHNLENIVYNELLYMGYKLNVYNNAGREIDFVAVKNNKKYFIQVAYSVVEEKTYNREMSAFANIDNLCKKIIITNDDIDFSTSAVKHIKLKDFLMMESLEEC
mgnify:CR=1 FL=1